MIDPTVRYTIIASESTARLEYLVNERRSVGGIVLGGVAVMPLNAGNFVLLQAMLVPTDALPPPPGV